MNDTSKPVRRGRRSVGRHGPHPIDVHVGGRIRSRRTLLGMSQTQLGDALGLTFQQVQKYERGTNRVSASRLYHISQVLYVPVIYFFEQMPVEMANAAPHGLPRETGSTAAADGSDPLTKRETLELVRAYYRIAEPRQRHSVYGLVKALGNSDED